MHPLLTLESPIEIMTIDFHPQDPCIIIGGGATGQLVMWYADKAFKEIFSAYDEFGNVIPDKSGETAKKDKKRNTKL